MLLVSTTADSKPFQGGTLVPDVSGPNVALMFLTDNTGELTLDSSWPPGIAADFDIYLQFWIKDATPPSGYASTNALRGTTP
jgi:hypothetical protein